MQLVKRSPITFYFLSFALHISVMAVAFNSTEEMAKTTPIPVKLYLGSGPKAEPKIVHAKPAPAPVVKKKIVTNSITKNVSTNIAPQEQTLITDKIEGHEDHDHYMAGNGDGGSVNGERSVKALYCQNIVDQIKRHKKYPRSAVMLNQEGKVIVSIKLGKNGKLIEVKVIDGSPHKSLARATLDAIKSVNKFPPIPEELKMDEISFHVPVDYKIEI